jgi:protein phosphatase
MQSPSDIKLEIFGRTDVGLVREHNEDNFLVADVTGGIRSTDLKEPLELVLGPQGALLLVCDGMGGAAAGEVASQMAVDSIYQALSESPPLARDPFARLLRRAVETANEKIFVQSRDNQSERGMGTTCTAAALVDGTLVVAQIGDSRCYVLRQGNLVQVTKDQSLAWQLIEAGAMTAEEAKAFEHANIILQALGVQERVEVVLSQVPLRRGDVVLLCSDGLHGPVADEELLEILAADSNLEKAAQSLIQKALERDGPDNITVVLARFDGPGLPEPVTADVVTFVPYDPGEDLEEERSSGGDTKGEVDRLSTAKATVEERVPPSLLAAAEEAMGTSAASSPDVAALSEDASEPAGRTARSVLAFFLLALVAAAAGGIFVLKCEREQAVQSEGLNSTP